MGGEWEPRLNEIRPMPEPGDRFRHTNTKKVARVESVARAEWQPGAYLVIYREEDAGDPLAWARPVDEFMGFVPGPSGLELPRFERLSPNPPMRKREPSEAPIGCIMSIAMFVALWLIPLDPPGVRAFAMLILIFGFVAGRHGRRV